MWGQRTTVYVNALYEKDVTANLGTKYYTLGSQRIAMRRGNTLTYLHGDHLGSTSVTANSSGGKVAELRYHPWGGTRFSSGTTPTARRYTGQIEDAAIGLYFYNARYYDPTLGRFIQADTIIPDPANPQSLNRYAYTLNNPLRYTDPTGHFSDDEILDWLKAQNPDNWESIWHTWQQNAAWMDWLRNAQFGDGLLNSLHDNPYAVFSLVDLYTAGSWAPGILRHKTGGGFDVISTHKNGYLHINAYTSVDSSERAFSGHIVRAGTMTLFSIPIVKVVGWVVGWSALAEAGWGALIGEKMLSGLAVGGSWFLAEAMDFGVPNHGCSVGDEAIYFDALWGHGYYGPNGKPLWLWWGGR